MEDIFDGILLSDEDDDVINIVEMPRQAKIFRERINHLQEWDDLAFINRFRISKESVAELLNQIEHLIAFPTDRNNVINPMQQLLIALRFYASGCMLITVGDFGGIHNSTASRIIYRVTQALGSLSRIYICMPQTIAEIAETMQEFYEIARFPKVIGAIDCTRIKIQSPGGSNAENFRNRKGYFSLNIQTVADARLRIRNIVARWPGAAHDSTIFSSSRLRADMENNYENCFIIGDAGYAVRLYLMTPLQNPTTRAEQLYNESQTRTRNVVERSYGVWKRRFPILSLGLRLKMETIQNVIVATAVLHNIAINNNDILPDNHDLEDNNYEVEQEEVAIDLQDNGYTTRRNLISNYFVNL